MYSKHFTRLSQCPMYTVYGLPMSQPQQNQQHFADEGLSSKLLEIDYKHLSPLYERSDIFINHVLLTSKTLQYK